VLCLSENRVGVAVGNCMTYTDDQLLVGTCLYAPSNSNTLESLYTTMPMNVTMLDDFVCGSHNRTGLMCSKCREGLSLAALSYQMECIQCSSSVKGIIIFFSLTFLPTTAFFLFVMLCNINLTSGYMNSILAVIQITLLDINKNPSIFIYKSSNLLTYYPTIFMLTIFGIFNLDFLRYVIPPFCISQSLTSLQAVALEYVIPMYYFLLIAITYICVEMYDKYHLVESL